MTVADMRSNAGIASVARSIPCIVFYASCMALVRSVAVETGSLFAGNHTMKALIVPSFASPSHDVVFIIEILEDLDILS